MIWFISKIVYTITGRIIGITNLTHSQTSRKDYNSGENRSHDKPFNRQTRKNKPNKPEKNKRKERGISKHIINKGIPSVLARLAAEEFLLSTYKQITKDKIMPLRKT